MKRLQKCAKANIESLKLLLSEIRETNSVEYDLECFSMKPSKIHVELSKDDLVNFNIIENTNEDLEIISNLIKNIDVNFLLDELFFYDEYKVLKDNVADYDEELEFFNVDIYKIKEFNVSVNRNKIIIDIVFMININFNEEKN